MVKTIVTGAGGRMGGRIISLMEADEGIDLAAAVERGDHPVVGRDVGEILGLEKRGIVVEKDFNACISKGDVAIDFTSHSASVQNLKIAAQHRRPMVIGSTGFSPEELEEIRGLAQSVPCVLAPNMSVGVNVLFKILKIVAEILGDDYDVEILEAHHHLKKDAPSGTAMKMAQIIAEALGRDLDEVGVYERKGLIGERSRKEIGIQTLRAGDIVGEHTILFGAVGERLELIHRAHSRDNFAKGAIRAAKWVVEQKPGLYDMQDVLGLRS
ncbi:dihydrodipicolinate reductase [Syntrophus gentianae]|uniref:4-hydroxy-tetrahydrodipicolinate reductase n=1 Tax=Syntrophus gentianae TaxID=43775 RepID=A0A1H7W1V9_9BACT|nr:4-hydroxy-tetrahydrodipicolinate reductase [Syntrophus gentianae]SEM15045.1 dihydrodipicolinate reductase [Syntrophus gentianae]